MHSMLLTNECSCDGCSSLKFVCLCVLLCMCTLEYASPFSLSVGGCRAACLLCRVTPAALGFCQCSYVRASYSVDRRAVSCACVSVGLFSVCTREYASWIRSCQCGWGTAVSLSSRRVEYIACAAFG